MEALIWIAHTLEAAGLASLLVVVLGLCLLVVRASRLSRDSQAERELAFLVAESGPDSTALRTAAVEREAPRELGHDRWQFDRDADGYLDLDNMAPCDLAAFYGDAA